MDVLQGAAQGLGLILSWPVLVAMMSGIVIGMCVGIIPGLGGLIAMALLLPFAIGHAPEVGLAFLLGMYAVTTQTDSIPAILIGVPGTSSATATSLDGYPLAKRGQAGRALSASYLGSIVGALVAGLVVILILPVLRPMLLQFASPEFLMMAVFGLVMVGAMVSGDVYRGLVMAGAGLILAIVGLSPGTGTPRLVFGQLYLWDGIPLIPLVLGLFAVPELVELATRKTSIARTGTRVTDSKYAGFRDIFVHRWLVLRCSMIGAVVGAVPGLGGPVAEWFAYGHAIQSARDPSQFGKGDIRGVIAPETATGAQKPGSVLPTIVFGIPGNPAMALLLGIFIMIGLQPGPKMLAEDLDITFLMIWVIVLANIIAAALALGLQPLLVRLCYVRAAVLVPVVMGLMVIGASTTTGSAGDLVAFAVFGLVGILLKAGNWPRVPIIMGLVLGKIAEPYLFITVDRYGAEFLWTRPVIVILNILIIATIVLAIRKGRSRRAVVFENVSPSGAARGTPTETPTPEPVDPWNGLGFGIGLLMAAIGLAVVLWASGLTFREKLFPMVAGGLVLSFALLSTLQGAWRLLREGPGLTAAWSPLSFRLRAVHLAGLPVAVGSVGVLLVLVYLLGHLLAVPLFIVIYMLKEGEKLQTAMITAVAVAGFIHVVFDLWLKVSLPVGRLLL